jgi:hypothetical protein
MTIAPECPLFLDARTLLRRIDASIRALRRLITHDHHDEAFWAVHQTTAPVAQSERESLRTVANLLHVERATTRGRIHGTRFVTLEAQREWLARQTHMLPRVCGLPSYWTLDELRRGVLRAS